MHKRILSIVLCLAMMMGFAVPAYATDGTTASDDIFIADDVIMSDVELTTSYDEDGNVVITTQSEETEAPAEETEAPAEETEAPVEETEAPTEETEAPTEETEAPVEETEAPTEETEAPVEETEAEEDLEVEDVTVSENSSNAEVLGGTQNWHVYNGYYDYGSVTGVNHVYWSGKFPYGDSSPQNTGYNAIYNKVPSSSKYTWNSSLDTTPCDLYFDDTNQETTIILEPKTTNKTQLVLDMFQQFYINNGAKVTIQLSDDFANAGIQEVVLKDPDTTAFFYVLGGSLTIKGREDVNIVIDVNPESNYAGIYMINDASSLTLENVKFRNANNGAIGLCANQFSNVSLKNCTFESTVTNGKYGGGAIFQSDVYQKTYTTTPHTISSKVHANNYCDIAQMTIENCTFDGVTTTAATAQLGYGGAIGLFGKVDKLDITNSTFTNCQAWCGGGAISIGGSAGMVNITDCTFDRCRAENYCGGAVHTFTRRIVLPTETGTTVGQYTRVNTLNVTDTQFKNGYAHQDGGAIGIQGQLHTLNISGTTQFIDNQARTRGGAIGLSSVTVPQHGTTTSGNATIYFTSSYTDTETYGEVNATVQPYTFTENNEEVTYRYTTIKNVNITGQISASFNSKEPGAEPTFWTVDGGLTLHQAGFLAVAQFVRVDSLIMNRLAIKDCETMGEGSCVYLHGADILDFQMNNCWVQGCDFTKNEAGKYTSDTLVGGTIRTIGNTGTTMKLYNCYFTNNTSLINGGAIYFNANADKREDLSGNKLHPNGCSATIENCHFNGNRAYRDGGAIYCESNVTVKNCLIQNNYARMGGGIAQQIYSNAGRPIEEGESTKLKLDSSTVITNNHAVEYSDEVHNSTNAYLTEMKSMGGNGGGISIMCNYTAALPLNTTMAYPVEFVLGGASIHNNYADFNGGGIYYITLSYDKNAPEQKQIDHFVKKITIDEGNIYNNVAGQKGEGGNGGGIYMESPKLNDDATGSTTLLISGGHIYNNTANKGDGGGVYLTGKEALCTITGGVVGGTIPQLDDNGNVVKDDDGNTVYVPSPNKALRTHPYGGNGGGIAISGGAEISMVKGTDASGKETTGQVTYNEAQYCGAGIWLNDGDATAGTGNSITIEDGDVCYNTVNHTYTTRYGGGVYVGTAGYFEITGGNVSHNYTPGMGGGVYITDGEALIDGGNIDYNTTKDGGGIAAVGGAQVTTTGGSISHNEASHRGGGVYSHGDGTQVWLKGGEISYNEAKDAGGGVLADDDAVVEIDKDTTKNTVGKVHHNTAEMGGGIYVAYGAELTVKNGHITYNHAVGTPGYTTAKADANGLSGTGGGILIGNGKSDTNPAKFTLDASAGYDVAIYGNIADFAADDVCANSDHTKLSIPSVVDMNLGDYGLPVMGWFEDYPNEDTSYTSGLKSAPNGVTPYVNGIADGYFASNENVRYRNVDAAKRREAQYTNSTTVETYAPNQLNAYVCLTLGIPAALDDVVVIDFGLPVDINVIANDAYLQNATLAAIGLKRPATANAFTEKLESAPTWTNLKDGGEFNSKYFSAVRKGNTNNITFTPMKMDVKDPMEFAYAVAHSFKGDNNETKTFYFYANVTVIPATNIYFEDSFVKFTNATGATSASGVWTQDRTTILKNQETDAPGPNADTEHPELDADNIYGYDDAYANFTTYSLGSAHMVTVDATTGFKDNAPKATFSFTGTGFDVVSLTNNDSGCLWVTVTDSAGNKVKSIIVSNYYGYTYCLCKVTNVFEFDKWVSYVDGKAPDGKAEAKPQYPSNPKHNTKVISYEYRWVADANASDTLYQVPVIKVDDLPYGTYDVEMKVVYLISQDIPANGQPGGSYTVWIDAIRVYNPRQGDATSENVYVQDGENNPHYTTVKKLLLDPNTYMANGSGIGYVDGKSSNVTLDEYANQGPNNEIYLRKDNGLAFKLRSYSSTKPEVNLQIGVKLAKGSTATLAWTYVSESGVYINGTDINVTTSTNMFYKLCNVQWSNTYSTLGYWESKPIYLKCSSTGNRSDGILSLTDLKLTGAGAAEIALPSSEESTVAVDGKLMAIYDGEVAQFVEDILKSEQSESQKTINLAYPTLSFEDEIKYNFYYTVENLDVAVEDMGLITWSAKPEDATFAAAETVIPGAIYNAATGEYMVRTNGIPAKKLGDDVYFKVYAKLSDGTYAYSSLARYSAKYYAEDRLENSNSAAMKAACVAMLNYGAAAQMHFGYKTDALVNADLNAEQKALVSEYSADMINALPTVDAAKAGDFVANGGFTTGYPTVSFEGAFAINYYFVPNKTIDGDLTLYCWDLDTYNSVDKLTADNATAKVVMTQTATGEYFGTYTGIAAKQIDETVFVACVYESEGVRYSTSVVPYSVGAYCVDKAANGSDTMKVFAAETAVFGHYAKIYFDNLQK